MGLTEIKLLGNNNYWTTANAKSVSVENYNRKWGAKKPSYQSFSAGSTFKFSANGDIDGFIKKITENGLGLRVNEGFGEVSVEKIATTKKMNTYIQNKKKEAEERKNNPKNKPELEIPVSDIPIDLFTQIIKNEVLKLAEIEGANVKFDRNKKLANSVNGQLLEVLRNSENEEQIKSEMQKRVTIRKTHDKQEIGDKKTYFEQEILKKFAKNLEGVKVEGNSLWNVFSNADSTGDVEKSKSSSKFLMLFPEEVEISLKQFDFEFYQKYWITALTKMMKGDK